MKTAIACFQSSVKGRVTFQQKTAKDPVEVSFQLENFPHKNKVHAVHIHEFGDISQGCQSLGGHWNPYRKHHGEGQSISGEHHAGDLINNLQTDAKKCFTYQYLDSNITLYGRHSIVGRSVVIHEGIDDLGKGGFDDSLTTGHAGARMACAVIGIASSNMI